MTKGISASLNPTDEKPETEQLKDAAKLLRKFLSSQGLQISHTVALEAMSHSVSALNWKTLRAKLGRQTPQPSFAGPRYLVNAIYQDNNQLYSEGVDADNPLQAAICVQLERLSDFGSCTRVDITEVVDRWDQARIVLAPSYLDELALVPFVSAVDTLLPLARMALGPAPARGVLEAEAWDQRQRALEFWASFCVRDARTGRFSHEMAKVLDDIYEEPDFDKESFGTEPPVMRDLTGEWQVVDPVQMLKTVLELASKALAHRKDPVDPKSSGHFQLEQLQQILDLYSERLAVAFKGIEVD